MLAADPEVAVPISGIRWRKKVHSIIKMVESAFLPCQQIFENRNLLRSPEQSPTPDSGIMLPDEPVIWMPNHGFRDDPFASVLAAQRHAYMVFGSLLQFYNTVDGITSWLNGLIMINRKVARSRKSSVAKADQVLQRGTDINIKTKLSS